MNIINRFSKRFPNLIIVGTDTSSKDVEEFINVLGGVVWYYNILYIYVSMKYLLSINISIYWEV